MNSSSRNLLAPGKYLYLCFLIYHVGLLWQLPCLLVYFKLSVSGSFSRFVHYARAFLQSFWSSSSICPNFEACSGVSLGSQITPWEMTMKASVLEGRFSLHLSGNIIGLVLLGLGREMRVGNRLNNTFGSPLFKDCAVLGHESFCSSSHRTSLECYCDWVKIIL